MSIRVMTLVWDRYPGSGSELLVMLALADWCNDDGGSLHPSIATVARKIRASESQARRIMHALIADGWLSVVGNASGGAPGSTRQYRLNVAKLAATAAATPSMGATPSADARGSMGARDGSHPCAETGSTHATQTVSRSVREPSRSLGGKSKVVELTADDIAFEATWKAYPKRGGGNSKQDARRAWNARRRDGEGAEELHAGVERYAAYIRGTGREHTEYVKQAATFFGPGRHYRERWALPAQAANGKSHLRTAIEGLYGAADGLDDASTDRRDYQAALPVAGSGAAG